MTAKSARSAGIFAILLLFIAALLTAAGAERSINIGVIAPLSGPFAPIGQEVQAGALLAAGAKNGKCAVSLKFEDDQIDPKKTLSSFFSLVSTGADGIVCFGSTNCHAIAAPADKHPVLVMALASDQKVPQGRRFVFRLEISPAAEAGKLVKHIAKKGYERIVSIIAEHDGPLAGHAALRSFPEFAAREVLAVQVLPSALDLRAEITRALKLDPDAVFLIHFGAPAGQAARLLRQQGYKGPLLGMNFVQTQEALDAAQGALEGIVFTNVLEPAEKFTELYRARYLRHPDYGAAHGYDAVTLLVRALCGSQSIDQAPQRLLQLRDFKGALGEYSSVGGNEFDIPVALKTVGRGRFFVLEPGGKGY